MTDIERLKLVAELWNNGKSVKDIARTLKLTRQGVYWLLDEYKRVMAPVDNSLDIRSKRVYASQKGQLI